jgi:signal recognition particle subunit SRP54
MIKQLGPIKDIFEKLPFFADGMPEGVSFDDAELVKAEAIVSSMTRQERVATELFTSQPSRVKRVARGSGRSETEVSELLQRFGFMRQMMGNIGQSAGLMSKLPGMKQLGNIKRMREMMKNMGGMPGMGGFPGMPGMGGGMGGIPGMGGMPGFPGMGGGMPDPAMAEQLLAGLMGGGAATQRKKPADKEKKKNLRKQQKKSRKKGR